MKHRHHLPQLEGGLFLTDGGIETTLIFHEGLDLPRFAAFDLLKDDEGTETLRRYFEPYAELARDHGLGFVLESPTWRASPHWAAEIGYSDDELAVARFAQVSATSPGGLQLVRRDRPGGRGMSVCPAAASPQRAALAGAVACAGGGAVKVDRVATETLEPRRNR